MPTPNVEMTPDPGDKKRGIVRFETKRLGMSEDRFVNAIIKVQRTYRLQYYVYRNFGPAMFYDSDGSHASHGKIDFLGSAPEPAKWIRVIPTSSPARLVKLFTHHWRLPKPEVIISVTGGAQNFTLSPQLQAAFDTGLVSAAKSAKAWLVSAGSDTGVMRLVGNAMSKDKVELPLIGIFPWGVTNGRERLAATVGREVPYSASAPSASGAPLNPHHTHFVLVDNGTVGSRAWGSEIHLRAEIVATISSTKNVPVVQLVVQGGPGTLATVEASCLEGSPVVILSNSGGAATAINAYFSMGIYAVEEKFRGAEAKLANIKKLNDAYDRKLVTFYSLDEGATGTHAHAEPELSNALLEAIVKLLLTQPDYARLPEGAAFKHPLHGRGRVLRVLADGRQAVSFRSKSRIMFFHGFGSTADGSASAPTTPGPGASTTQEATDQAESRPQRTYSWQDEDLQLNRSKIDVLVSKAIGLTVVWNRPELARWILAALGGKMGSDEVGGLREVALALQRALELQRTEVTEFLLHLPGIDTTRINMGRLYMMPDELRFLRNDRGLQARLSQFISSMPYEIDIEDPSVQANNYHAFKRATIRFLSSISPLIGHLVRGQEHTERHDIFFWLVLCGNENFARQLWAVCDLPVHMMLLGAQVARAMSTAHVKGDAEAAARVQRMQEWATGAMEMAPDEARAHHVLETCIPVQSITAVDIAMNTEAKVFLAQAHCVSLIKRWWRGSARNSSICLHPGTSYLWLLAQLCCPLLHPGVLGNPVKVDNTESLKHNVFDAVGMYMNISSAEHKGLEELQQEFARQHELAREQGSEAEAAKNPRMPRIHARQRRNAAHRIRQTAREATAKEDTLLSRIAAFYAIPAVKFLMRVLVHLFVTVLYLVLIFHKFEDPSALDSSKTDASVPWDKKLPLLSDAHWSETLWLICEFGLWLDKRHQSYMSTLHVATRHHTRGLAYFFNLLFDLLLLVALGIRVAMEVIAANELGNGACCEQPCDETCDAYEHGRELYQVFQVLIAFKAIDVGFKWFTFINCHQRLGVLIVMISEMVGDINLFLVLFSVVCGATMVGGSAVQTAGLYEMKGPTDEPWNAFAASGNFWSPLWLTFGQAPPLSNYTWVSAIIALIYCFFTTVVMVNLLVAMFADTYMRVKESSYIEFAYLECKRLFVYRDMVASVPPVFNIPLIMCDFCMKLKCSAAIHDASSRVASLVPGVLRRASIQLHIIDDIEPRTFLKRSSSREGSVRALGESPTADRKRATKSANDPYDGKSFVEAYLREQRKMAADSPQAIAVSIIDGFTRAEKKTAEETHVMKEMLSQLVAEVGQMKAGLAKRDELIDTLLDERNTMNVAAALPRHESRSSKGAGRAEA